jgi:hypothetical protein
MRNTWVDFATIYLMAMVGRFLKTVITTTEIGSLDKSLDWESIKIHKDEHTMGSGKTENDLALVRKLGQMASTTEDIS